MSNILPVIPMPAPGNEPAMPWQPIMLSAAGGAAGALVVASIHGQVSQELLLGAMALIALACLMAAWSYPAPGISA